MNGEQDIDAHAVTHGSAYRPLVPDNEVPADLDRCGIYGRESRALI